MEELKQKIIDYLWDREVNELSAEEMLYTYKELSATFFDGVLFFNCIDDYSDELFIICSIDINTFAKQSFSVVIDWNVWSSGVEDIADTLIKLNNKRKEYEEFFKSLI